MEINGRMPRNLLKICHRALLFEIEPSDINTLNQIKPLIIITFYRMGYLDTKYRVYSKMIFQFFAITVYPNNYSLIFSLLCPLNSLMNILLGYYWKPLSKYHTYYLKAFKRDHQHSAATSVVPWR